MKKDEKIIEEISFAILELLFEAKEGVEKKELFYKLELSENFRSKYRKALSSLLKKKKIYLEENHYFLKDLSHQKLEGILSVTTRGFGFVKTSESLDVFISLDSMNNALDGDKVEIEIKNISEKGPEGKIIKVLERKYETLVGTVIEKKGHKYKAFCAKLGREREAIISSEQTLLKNDRILFQIDKFEKDIIFGTFLKKLGNIEDASKDIQIAIEEFHLNEHFSNEAILEAKSKKISIENEKRKDLTHLTIFTIDPVNAKDFDDALSLEKDKKGYHLGVHIADVAHFVEEKSALDKEAFNRGNSIYFPKRVIPMLPFELSSNLCSLRPHQKRLTVSVFMDFDLEGNLTDYQIFRSVIESKNRFTYEEVKKILDHSINTPFTKILFEMKELTLLLKKIRTERGSIDLALSEAQVEVDKNGNPQKLIIHEYDTSHQIVEEFMLKANETVAKHLADKKKYLIYRIHEAPSPESLQSFFSLARALGYDLKENPSLLEIQDLLQESEKSFMKQRLSLQYLKSMKLAHYSPDNIGHYGLALEHYTHFTSPIRRYNDLMIQRLLFEEMSQVDLYEIALKCSEKERDAMKAENSVTNLKKLRLAKKYFKENPKRKYKALIYDVKPFGFSFYVEELALDGFIHVSASKEYLEFIAESSLLFGTKSKKKYQMGHEAFLQIETIDLATSSIFWKI